MLSGLLLMGIFILLSLGQLGRLSLFSPQVNFYSYEIGVFLFFILLVLRYKTAAAVKNGKNFLAVYLFFLLVFFSFIIGIPRFSALENSIGFFYFVRLAVYWFYWLYLLSWLKEKNTNRYVLYRSLQIFTVLTGIFSAAQYLLYPNLRNLIYAGWDPHLYRVFGTFFDTSAAAAIFGMIILAFLLKKKIIFPNPLFFGVGFIIYLILGILTFSRLFYFCLLIVVVGYLAVKKFFPFIWIFLGIFAILVILAPKPFGEGVKLLRTSSIESRWRDYGIAFSIWKKYPFFGIGYNRIRYEKIKRNIIAKPGADITHSGAAFHSSFLTVAVTGGMLGLMLFLFILYKLTRMGELTKYLTVFLSLMSLGDNILLHPFVLFLFINLILWEKFIPLSRTPLSSSSAKVTKDK